MLYYFLISDRVTEYRCGLSFKSPADTQFLLKGGVMKFKVAGKREEREQVVTLGLIDDGNDEVIVAAVDADGDKITGGNLFIFKKSGKVYRCAHVSPGLGFCLNGLGEIEVV
jgi:hypothetical protein